MGSGTIRVVIADDNSVLRRVVRRQLELDPEIEVVGEVGQGAAGAEDVEEMHPDVLLVDLSMRDAETLATRLAEEGARILPWTVDHHGNVITQVIQTGAAGLILKQTGGVRDVGNIIRRVVAGELVVSEEVAPSMLRELVKAHSEALETMAQLEFAREAIESQLAELQETYRSTVHALAASVEMRDAYTGGHIDRVCTYSLAVAETMDASLTRDEIVFGYILHDVGKLAIPDAVLLKPDKLSGEEIKVIQSHTVHGARWVQEIPFLLAAMPIVRNHHERWDGRGYPDRLEAEETPLVARIFALCDALDAVTTDRPYRPALTLDYAVEEFSKCAGSQFDPAVVHDFREVVQVHPAFEDLRRGIVPGRVGATDVQRP